MGDKIKKWFLLLHFCLFVIAGCGSADFGELEGPNVFYQIYTGDQNILRIRYTIGEGAPYIQLFDNKGNLLQESVVAPESGFLVTSVKNDLVQITYFVGESDLDMFLPWFKTNKFNPTRIGKYSINYNYEIRNSYSDNKGSKIDSLNVDITANTTSLFLKGKLVATRPTYLLILKSSEFLAYDPENKVYTPYQLVNKDLTINYLKKILAVYDTRLMR